MIVIDQEKLYNQLKSKVADDIQVLHLPKSGGVSTFSNIWFMNLTAGQNCSVSLQNNYIVSVVPQRSARALFGLFSEKVPVIEAKYLFAL